MAKKTRVPDSCRLEIWHDLAIFLASLQDVTICRKFGLGLIMSYFNAPSITNPLWTSVQLRPAVSRAGPRKHWLAARGHDSDLRTKLGKTKGGEVSLLS